MQFCSHRQIKAVPVSFIVYHDTMGGCKGGASCRSHESGRRSWRQQTRLCLRDGALSNGMHRGQSARLGVQIVRDVSLQLLHKMPERWWIGRRGQLHITGLGAATGTESVTASSMVPQEDVVEGSTASCMCSMRQACSRQAGYSA